MRYKNTRRGFTIIELMLAMAFFSSILVLGTSAFVQMLGIYNKGVAVKQMNQVGRTLTDGIIRNANQNVSKITVKYGSGPTDTRPRCLVLGNTTYLWSYASDFDATPGSNVYKYSATAPVNFVRYNSARSLCPNFSDTIVPSEVSAMVGDTVRVYTASMVPVPSQPLLDLRFVLGTYAGPGAASNVQINPITLDPFCNTESIGNFCAFGTYQTTIFLSSGSGV